MVYEQREHHKPQWTAMRHHWLIKWASCWPWSLWWL